MSGNVTRVLLSVEQPLHAQLLKHAFAADSGLQLIGETTDVVECLRLIAWKEPHLWVHSWDEGPELQAVLSNIYDYQPRLSIVRISPNEPAGYIQLQVHSLADLLRLASRTHLLFDAA